MQAFQNGLDSTASILRSSADPTQRREILRQLVDRARAGGIPQGTMTRAILEAYGRANARTAATDLQAVLNRRDY